MWQRWKTWWKQYNCLHLNCEGEVWIINDGAPLVKRSVTCRDCGKPIVSQGCYLPYNEMIELLDRARELPVGSSELVKRY